jgi:Uma2 family endonuclease
MATATHSPKMTIEEFLALPEDGVYRELIAGEVRERGPSIHGMLHASCLARLTYLIGNWSYAHPSRGVEVLAGQPGFIMQRDPPTVVGPDFAVVDADVPTDPRYGLVEGVPRLAVEILSPSDNSGDIHEKVRLYLKQGVAAVWVVNPDDQCVQICRTGQPVILLSGEQLLTCEPELPGFSVRAGELFG